MRKLAVALFIALALSLTVLPQSLFPIYHAHAQDTRGTKGGDPDIRVWVNTGSGIYWCPGSRWYGKTKEGFYTSQRNAQRQGYRAAYYEVCD